MRETALANVVFLRRMIPFHLCIQTWHSGVSLAAGPVYGLLEWAYLSGRAGRWRSLFSHSRLCSCTVSGWQEAACAALPSDGYGLDLTPYFTKYFLKYFLLGPCSYAIFMPDPAPVGCLFRSVPCSFFPFLPPILLSISLLKNACCNGCPRIIRACFCSGRTPPASSWDAIRSRWTRSTLTSSAGAACPWCAA